VQGPPLRPFSANGAYAACHFPLRPPGQASYHERPGMTTFAPVPQCKKLVAQCDEQEHFKSQSGYDLDFGADSSRFTGESLGR
jgi:hypothetical protein